MLRQIQFLAPVKKVKDSNGVSTEAPEMKFVFALLDQTKAREGTYGPIESLHPSIKAATSVSDHNKHAPVKLRDISAGKTGDHPILVIVTWLLE